MREVRSNSAAPSRNPRRPARRGQAAVVVAAALLAWAGQAAPSRAAEVSAPATANATVKPAGPRTGASGTNFLNVEGNGNGANASYGVLDFSGSSFVFGGTVTDLSAVRVVLTEANAAFTAPGSINFFLTRDTTTSISNAGTPAPTTPNFDATSLPGGMGTQFDPKSLVGTGAFTTTGNVNSGQVDTYTLTGLSASDKAYLINQLNTGGPIRFIAAPGDATVAATFAGATNATAAIQPMLSISATVPEPTAAALAPLAGLVLFARRRGRR